MRVRQDNEIPRGSLKWIQRAVNRKPELLAFDQNGPVNWLSPLETDAFAEYRDASFLELLGLAHVAEELSAFWPARGGPQWDALGRRGHEIILVEAKAHVRELLSPPCAARSEKSLKVIRTALDETKHVLGADAGADWMSKFYQYANRLAHLHFLHSHRVKAHLVNVCFVGDHEMGGPDQAETWHAALACANYALGLKPGHYLSPFVHHICPHVRTLT